MLREKSDRVLANFARGRLAKDVTFPGEKVRPKLYPPPGEKVHERTSVFAKRNALILGSMNQQNRRHPAYQSLVAVPHAACLLDDCADVGIIRAGREREKSAE
jgi:hypothetical protein